MEFGQKYRFENPGHNPREYVHVDPKTLDVGVANQFGCHGDFNEGSVQLLKRTDVKKRKAQYAAITPAWLSGRRGPGQWVAIT